MPRWYASFSVVTVVLVLLLLGVPQNGFRAMMAQESVYAVEDSTRLAALETENAELRAALEHFQSLEKRVRSLEQSPIRDQALLVPSAYALPDQLSLCGEVIPLHDLAVRQRFREEFERFLVNRHWVSKWNRRVATVFPEVERRLAAAGLPDDLKYVLVIESGVDARAVSSAGAVGWWQFINGTAKRYGLRKNKHIDERRDLGLATDAAIRYFSDLHTQFESWPLALSAYNAGENRIAGSIEEQGTDDFYQLVLPRETEAYWFKAAAAKAMLQSASEFGLGVAERGSTRSVCDTLTVKVASNAIPIRDLIEGSGLGYRTFKELNPALRTASLPRGEWRLAVPREVATAFVEGMEGARLVAHRRASARPDVAEPASPGEGASLPAVRTP